MIMGGQKSFFTKKTARDVPLDGVQVLLRADYNVPLDKETGKIADEYRITQSIPTLKYLLHERNAAVVVCSHLGRPDGTNNVKLSLSQVAGRLSELLDQDVLFVDASVGDKVRVAAKKLRPGQLLVLENLRFHPEEEVNDAQFAKQLAEDTAARYFVQDGFGVVHRAHASTSAITQYLPSVGGLLLEKEYQHILGAMQAPKRPLTAVMGGAKIADKIEVIDAFITLADKIIIGGAMANTFLQFKGKPVGRSLVEPDEVSIIEKIYRDTAAKVGHEHVDQFIVLPTDVAVASGVDSVEQRREVSVDMVGEDDMILDIGQESITAMEHAIGNEGTVIWNGTLGYAEKKIFSFSSARLSLHLARHHRITSVIGGGDTADFVLGWDTQNAGRSFTHISTGGGASLELMAGKKLPGVEALLKA